MPQANRSVRIMLALITIVALVWALRASWVISMPLTFAIFLAVVLRPLQRRLQAWGAPRWLAALGVLATVAAALGILLGALWLAVRQILQRGPEYAAILRERFDALRAWFEEQGLSTGQSAGAGVVSPESVDRFTNILVSILTAIGIIVFITFLLVLLLFEAEQWRIKTRRIFDNDTSREIFRTADIITRKLERYLLIRVLVSAISGTLAGLWCVVLGVEFAFVWGVSSFALNFLPNIGSLISFIPPTLVAWMQHDWKWGVLTFACISGTDMIMGNVIDPRLQGHNLRLSPFVVLFAVVFWGWMWGVAGALLAVPITASLVIIVLHVRGLEPFGRWLSEV